MSFCGVNHPDELLREFRRWGVLGDWDNSYLTLDNQYEAEQIGVFGLLYKKGHRIMQTVQPPVLACLRTHLPWVEASTLVSFIKDSTRGELMTCIVTMSSLLL
jgi:isoleucyl-tRNA synthetase